MKCFQYRHSGCEDGRKVDRVCCGEYLQLITYFIIFILICAGIAVGKTTESSPQDKPETEVAGDPGRVDLDTPKPTSSKKEVKSSANVSQSTPRRISIRRETPFAYESRGRRDPFRALISDSKREANPKTDLLCLDEAVLTGVVWSGGEYLAMIRDKGGKNFFLREGDKVYRGRVTSVTQAKAVFRLVDFGEVERVTLTVRSNEGKSGSN